MFELSAHGTTIYLPPEVTAAREAKQNSIQVSTSTAARIDTFALGLMLRYMLLGIGPDKKLMSTPAPPRVGCFACLWRTHPPRLVRDVSELPPDVASLIAAMTREDAATRIGLSQVANHPFLRGGGLPCESHECDVVVRT